MEPTVLRPTASKLAAPESPPSEHTASEQPAAGPALSGAQPPAPRLDLSRMEPPRRLAEARLEEVTIDGICGVY